MVATQNICDTTLALVVRVREDLLEIRFKEGIKMDLAGLEEITTARRTLFPTPSRLGCISLIPESADFHLSASHVDHFAHPHDGLIALAVVARGATLEMMTKLYFSYFPQRFQVLATNNEGEARQWMEQQLARTIQQ